MKTTLIIINYLISVFAFSNRSRVLVFDVHGSTSDPLIQLISSVLHYLHLNVILTKNEEKISFHNKFRNHVLSATSGTLYLWQRNKTKELGTHFYSPNSIHKNEGAYYLNCESNTNTTIYSRCLHLLGNAGIN